MWVSVGMMMAAALTGQEPPTEPVRQYRNVIDAELARRAADSDEPDDTAESWGLEIQPRLTVSQRMDRDCADGVRAADESQAACRERIAEAAIQDSLARGDVTRRTSEWTEENEREWVRAPRRNPIDRLRDCRQSSERSQDGERSSWSSWSVRCGDQDGPAAQALERLLNRD